MNKSNNVLHIIGQISNVVFFILLLVVILFTIISAVSENTGKDILGVQGYIVLTGSMSGTNKGSFPAGSYIISKSMKPEEYKVGDVVTYSGKINPKVKVTHRIIEVTTSPDDGQLGFITKGDANDAEDGFIEGTRLNGKTIFAIPVLGALLFQMRDKYFLAATGVYILLMFLMPVFVKDKKNKYERN